MKGVSEGSASGEGGGAQSLFVTTAWPCQVVHAVVVVPAAFDIAALVYPVSDMACCLLLVLFIAYLRHRVASVSRRIDGSNVTPADYSVIVRGLPHTADVPEVLNHFNNLYDLQREDWTFKGHCCWIGRKMRKRKAVVSASSEPSGGSGSAVKVRHAPHHTGQTLTPS